MYIWGICFLSSLLLTSTFATVEGVAEDAIREFKLWLKTEHTGKKLTISIYNDPLSIQTGFRNNLKVAVVYLELKHGAESQTHEYVDITMRRFGETWQLSGVGTLSANEPEIGELEGSYKNYRWDWRFVWNTNTNKKNGTKLFSSFIREKVFDSSNGTNTIRVYKQVFKLYFVAYRTPPQEEERVMQTSTDFATSAELNSQILMYVREKVTAFRLGPWTNVSADLERDVNIFTDYFSNTVHKNTPFFHKIRQFGDTPDRFFLHYKLAWSDYVYIVATRLRGYSVRALRMCLKIKTRKENVDDQILKYLTSEHPFLVEVMYDDDVSKFESFLPWIEYNSSSFNPCSETLKLISVAEHGLNSIRVIGIFARIGQNENEISEIGYVLVSVVELNKVLQLETLRLNLQSDMACADEISELQESALPDTVINWYYKRSSNESKWDNLKSAKEINTIEKISGKRHLELVQHGRTETNSTVAIYNCEGKRTLCVVKHSDRFEAFEIYDPRDLETDLFHYFREVEIYKSGSHWKGSISLDKYVKAIGVVEEMIRRKSSVGEVTKLKVRNLGGSLGFLKIKFAPAKTEESEPQVGATVIFAVINPEGKDDATRILYVSPPLNEVSANEKMKSFMRCPTCMLEEQQLSFADIPKTNAVQNDQKKLSEN